MAKVLRLTRTVEIPKEQTRQMRRLAEFQRRYGMIMPIKAHVEDSLCRDEFLRRLCDDMKFDDVEESESVSDEEPPRYSKKMSLSSFMESAAHILRTTKRLESFKTWDADPQNFNVMTGRLDNYNELLESMKLSSLSYLFTRVIERLSAMHSISLEWINMDVIEVPHSLFKWSMEAFFKRCQLPDPVYLDVLMLKYSEDMLDWIKFSLDLSEMQRYFRYFQMDMFTEKSHSQLKTIIWHQQQLLDIGDEMDKALLMSSKKYEAIENSVRNVTKSLASRKVKYLIQGCVHTTMEAFVQLPIEWRYVRDYYASVVDIQKHKDNAPIVQLNEQIKNLRQLMNDHEKTSFQSNNIYQLTIEVCRFSC